MLKEMAEEFYQPIFLFLSRFALSLCSLSLSLSLCSLFALCLTNSLTYSLSTLSTHSSLSYHTLRRANRRSRRRRRRFLGAFRRLRSRLGRDACHTTDAGRPPQARPSNTNVDE
jgi:hypothetical protein